MPTIYPTNRISEAGVPGQWEQDFAPLAEGLITGPQPAMMTEDMTLAANTEFPQYTPVGLDGSGNLVPAVSGTTQAIGLIQQAVTTGAAPVKGYPVLRGGRLNPDVIAWPVSYDTFEKKLEAFRGAPSPTNIVVAKVYRGATVGQP